MPREQRREVHAAVVAQHASQARLRRRRGDFRAHRTRAFQPVRVAQAPVQRGHQRVDVESLVLFRARPAGNAVAANLDAAVKHQRASQVLRDVGFFLRALPDAFQEPAHALQLEAKLRAGRPLVRRRRGGVHQRARESRSLDIHVHDSRLRLLGVRVSRDGAGFAQLGRERLRLVQRVVGRFDGQPSRLRVVQQRGAVREVDVHGRDRVRGLDVRALRLLGVVEEHARRAAVAPAGVPKLTRRRRRVASAGGSRAPVTRRVRRRVRDDVLQVPRAQALRQQARHQLVRRVVGDNGGPAGRGRRSAPLYFSVRLPGARRVSGALAHAQEGVHGSRVQRYGRLLLGHLVYERLSLVHVPGEHVSLEHGGVDDHVRGHPGHGFHATENLLRAAHVARVDVGVEEAGVRVAGGDQALVFHESPIVVHGFAKLLVLRRRRDLPRDGLGAAPPLFLRRLRQPRLLRAHPLLDVGDGGDVRALVVAPGRGRRTVARGLGVSSRGERERFRGDRVRTTARSGVSGVPVARAPSVGGRVLVTAAVSCVRLTTAEAAFVVLAVIHEPLGVLLLKRALASSSVRGLLFLPPLRLGQHRRFLAAAALLRRGDFGLDPRSLLALAHGHRARPKASTRFREKDTSRDVPFGPSDVCARRSEAHPGGERRPDLARKACREAFRQSVNCLRTSSLIATLSCCQTASSSAVFRQLRTCHSRVHGRSAVTFSRSRALIHARRTRTRIPRCLPPRLVRISSSRSRPTRDTRR